MDVPSLRMKTPRVVTRNLALALVELILHAHVREYSLHLPQVLRLRLRMPLGGAVLDESPYVSDDSRVTLVVGKPPMHDLRLIPELGQIATKARGVDVAVQTVNSAGREAAKGFVFTLSFPSWQAFGGTTWYIDRL